MKTNIAFTNMLFLFIRMTVTMGISLFTSRIILEALGVSDYGIYNVVGGMVAMIAFLHYSLNGATMRFMNLAISRGVMSEMRLVFNTAFFIHIIIALVIVLLGETVGLWFFYNKLNIPENRVYAASWVYQFSIAAMVLNVIQIPYDSAIIAHQKMKVFAFASILESVLKLGVAFLVLHSFYDKLILYGFLLLVVSLIIRLTYQIYCRRKFEECKFQLSLDKSMFREIAIFFGWDLFGNISALLRIQGVNILQNIFFGTLINAAMGLANIVGSSVTAISSNINLALKPQIFQSYFDNDEAKVNMLISLGTRVSFYLLLIVCVPIILETEFFLNLWLKEVPKFSIEFTQLVLLSSLLGVLFDYLTVLINATGKIKLLSVLGGFIYCTSVLTSYILLKNNYDKFTTSIIAIIVNIIMGAIILFLVKKLVKNFPLLSFLKNVILRCLLIFLFSLGIGILIKNNLNESFTLVPVIIMIAVIFITVIIFGISKIEKIEMLNLVRNILKVNK